jgi:hypothetical protein
VATASETNILGEHLCLDSDSVSSLDMDSLDSKRWLCQSVSFFIFQRIAFLGHMDEQPDAVTCSFDTGQSKPSNATCFSLPSPRFPPQLFPPPIRNFKLPSRLCKLLSNMKAWPIPYRLDGQGKPQDSKEHEGIFKTTSAPELQQLSRFHHHQIFKVVRKVTVKYAGQQTQDRGNVNASSFILQVELNLMIKLQVFGS